MRYRRAVEKLRILADACQGTTRTPTEEPFLREAHVFGAVLDGEDPIDYLEVAFVLNLPPEQVRAAQTDGTPWLVHTLRLGKGGFAYWWRSRDEPVWNHHIRGPVRFWSLDGTDEDVLDALAGRRFADLPRVTADPAEMREQTAVDLASALDRLRAVWRDYWESDWRRRHRGHGQYPENELWDAVDDYLNLLETDD